MSEQTSPGKSSVGSGFFAGLTIGVLAGVVGYYLFGTKQGQQTREKISTEWQRAQALMSSSTTAKNPDSEKWQTFFNQMGRELGFHRRRQASKPKQAKPTAFVKKVRQAKKSLTKFTGV